MRGENDVRDGCSVGATDVDEREAHRPTDGGVPGTPTTPSHGTVLDVTTSRGGIPYRSYGSRWGARWLVPAERDFRVSALQLYLPTTVGGHLRRASMRLGVGGESLALDRETLSRWEGLLGDVVRVPEARLAFYVGNATALGKTTMLVMDATAHPVGIAKATAEPHAGTALENEWRMLGLLGRESGMDGKVPTPLGLLKPEGYTVLVTTFGPVDRGPPRFTRAHAAWLGALRRPFRRRLAFEASGLWRRSTERLDQLSGGLSPIWLARYEAAFLRLSGALGGRLIEVSLAHRDFAPWNTRSSASGLYVFDFELAAFDFPAAIDWYHFHFMTSLLLDRGAGVSEARHWMDGWDDMRGWESGDGMGGAGTSHDAGPAAFLLAYLVDVSLEYHRFQRILAEDEDDPVLTQAGYLLDRVAEWWRSS